MASSNNSEDEKEFHIKFNSIPNTLTNPFIGDFAGYPEGEGLVRAEPGGITLTPDYARDARQLYNFEPRLDDVWILTFQKSGQCFIPRSTTHPGLQEVAKQFPTIEELAKLPSPRILKGHIPFYMLHPKLLDTSKVIYVARNPKDVIVSYCHHNKLVKLYDFKGDIELFAKYFMNNEDISTPYFNHVLDAWSKRSHPNMLFLFYEDMKENFEKETRKVAKFLNKSITDEQVKKLSTFLEFSNRSKDEINRLDGMQSSGLINAKGLEERGFMRKGETGDWKNHFSPQLNEEIDQWIEKNLAGLD